MGTTAEKVPFWRSLQTKYALTYLVVIAAVLALLNTYPVLASQDLLFTSKRDSLKSQTAVMASALMELESLSAEQVARVMNMLDSMGTTRILVTDPAGLILYDSTRQPGEEEADSRPRSTATPCIRRWCPPCGGTTCFTPGMWTGCLPLPPPCPSSTGAWSSAPSTSWRWTGPRGSCWTACSRICAPSPW